MIDITLTDVTQTSVACPSQWDAHDQYGRYWYLRYRHGRGSAEQFPNKDWHLWGPAADDKRVFYTGDPLDGFITLEDFCERVGFELDPIYRRDLGDD
jgi:hypothetical protein